MDKRSLSAVPRPSLTKKNKQMLLLVPHMSYLATADRREINGEDTLIINFFHAEEKELKPEFRTFCQMDDYITQDLSMDKTKWKTGAINHLTGYLYWYRNSGNIVIASIRERNKILGFLRDFRKRNGIGDHEIDIPKGAAVDSEVENRIDEYQNTIKGWKLQKRHREEKADIDLQMQKFGELPADYGHFVKDVVFENENYIFYSKAKARAYCTKCGHEFEVRKDGLYHMKIAIWNDVDEISHNRTVRCPYCHKYLKCKSEGMGRKNLFAVQWSVLVQKYGEEVLVRYFCHTKDFQGDFHNPAVKSIEKFRTIHSADKSRDFEWCRYKSTVEIRWCNFKDRSYVYCQPPQMDVPRSVVLYKRNLLEAVAGTCMKYSAVDIYVNNVVETIHVSGSSCDIGRGGNVLRKPWCIDWYFNAYREAPYLEQLLKVGFYKIAQEALKERNRPEFKNGGTVTETLGINRLQFHMLRQIGDPSIRDVMILRYAGQISKEDFETLRYSHDDGYDKMYEKYLDMRQYTTIYKLKKYLGKQKIIHDRDYFDYVKWLEEMGYDLHNEFNLYPRDFQKAHDEKSKEHLRIQDQKAAEEIRRFNSILKKLRKEVSDTDPINLRIKGLFIRLPENLEELKKEGECLHHCVGNYRDKVARGETMIFFIRREEEPEKPYFTLEWKGKVIQCRGSHNCDMTPEVKAFAMLFQKKMEVFENAPRKHRKAG